MRTLIQPPPSLHCDFCHGGLLLKRIDPDGPVFDAHGAVVEFDTEIFVCTKCGREKWHVVSHDPYTPRPAGNINMSPAKVG